jgi:hypothetical protein
MTGLKEIIIVAMLQLAGLTSFSQTDTIVIDRSDVNTTVLKTGTHRYLVYFKNGVDSSRIRYQLWSRKIDRLQYKGQEAISVTQEWENNDTVFHTVYTVCDKKSFAPLFQESWNRGRGTMVFDFINKKATVNGTAVTEADTARAKKMMYDAFKKSLDQYVLDWHLDLEVFPILPYKTNTTFMINFYDPGFPEPALQAYTVSGSGALSGYNGQQIDCWLLTHRSTNNEETFWISKETREVLKLEQKFGERFRYKIKLGFSD